MKEIIYILICAILILPASAFTTTVSDDVSTFNRFNTTSFTIQDSGTNISYYHINTTFVYATSIFKGGAEIGTLYPLSSSLPNITWSQITSSIGNWSSDRNSILTGIDSNYTASKAYTDTRIASMANDTNTDYCAGGTCTGDLLVNGNFKVIGDVTNLTVEQTIANGSYLFSLPNLFDIGSSENPARAIYGSLGCGNITGASSNLCTITDRSNSTNDIWAAISNNTWDIKISSLTNLTLAQIVANIGNWSSDKSSYPLASSLPNLTRTDVVNAVGNYSAAILTNFTPKNCSSSERLYGYWNNGTAICGVDATASGGFSNGTDIEVGKLIIRGLNNCDTINTTSTGQLVCGNDGGGTGSFDSPFTNVDNSYILNLSGTLTFNQSKLSTSYFNASINTTVRGTPSGEISYLNLYDGVPFNVTEESGATGLDFRVNFTGISAFNQLIFRYKSSTTENHLIQVQLYDYLDSDWENYATLSNVPSYNIKQIGVFDYSDHINNGVVSVRFVSTDNGNTGHIHYFDWVTISNGLATPAGTEIDPYSWHRDTVIDTGTFKTTGDVVANSFNGTWNGSINYPLSSSLPNLSRTDVVNAVGNWSLDKSNYPLSSSINNYSASTIGGWITTNISAGNGSYGASQLNGLTATQINTSYNTDKPTFQTRADTATNLSRYVPCANSTNISCTGGVITVNLAASGTTYTGGANISVAGNVISINKSFEEFQTKADTATNLSLYETRADAATNISTHAATKHGNTSSEIRAQFSSGDGNITYTSATGVITLAKLTLSQFTNDLGWITSSSLTSYQLLAGAFTSTNYTALHTKANHYDIGVLTVDNETAIDAFIADDGYALGSSLNNYSSSTIGGWITTNITSSNTSMKSYVDVNFALASSLPNLTMQQINNSFKNFSQWLSTYPNVDTDSTNDILGSSLPNITMQQINNSFGNWSQDKPNYQLTAGAYKKANLTTDYANLDTDSTNDLSTSTSWSGDLGGTGSSPTVVNTRGISTSNITSGSFTDSRLDDYISINGTLSQKFNLLSDVKFYFGNASNVYITYNSTGGYGELG